MLNWGIDLYRIRYYHVYISNEYDTLRDLKMNSLTFHPSNRPVTASEMTLDLIKRYWWDDGDGMVYFELTDGRSFHFEKFDKEPEAQALADWIDENWSEFDGSKEIQDERETPWGLQLPTITVHHTPGTYQDDFKPTCPICGMTASEDSDGEINYACGHFIGVYNDWYHDDENLKDYMRQSSDKILTSHVTAGQNEWFFYSHSDTLDAVMSAGEVAVRFGLAEPTVRQAINRGQIPARKSGGTWLVLREDAERKWKK